jgi:hypothetical protein
LLEAFVLSGLRLHFVGAILTRVLVPKDLALFAPEAEQEDEFSWSQRKTSHEFSRKTKGNHL